jgi:hypothetical protein
MRILSVQLIGAGLFLFQAACSPSAQSPAAPYVLEGLEAYRKGDTAALEKAAEALEIVGGNAKLTDAEWLRSTYGAAARLRALKAIIDLRPPLSEAARFSYAERLCASDSWVEGILPAAEGRQTGCDAEIGFFTRWRLWLLATDPFAFFRNHVPTALVDAGLILPSPHAVAGIPAFIPLQLVPLTPRRFKPRPTPR